MQNGFIYEFVEVVIKCLKYLNLVELFKIIAKGLAPTPPPTTPPSVVPSQEAITYMNIAIDIFQVLKWLFVFLVWYTAIDNGIVFILVWYLLFANLYTYFYYHLWDSRLFSQQSMTENKQKRRFINSLLAIAFSNFCFAYLYAIPFKESFNWEKTLDSTLTPLYYSIATCLTLSINGVSPANSTGNLLTMIQGSITFIFVAILLSKSIPQDNGTGGSSGGTP